MKTINVIGAGLAGCEAAYQIAKKGINVKLYEMRPVVETPAHKTENFAELVCSNSLRANGLSNAVGVMKEEMRQLDSLIMKAADANSLPAGGALAVDRENFSKFIEEELKKMDNIEIIKEEVTTIPEGPTIIASGPLTSDKLSKSIAEFFGEEHFYFFDAAAPIIELDSINMDKAYLKSRYDKGEAAYINCPMNKDEFNNWYDVLIKSEVVKPKDFELKIFEGCMPFEVMAKRGRQTLLYGPMKPVGLETPDGERPYAVVQLRQDNAVGNLYNIVGFQTHLKFGEQKKIIQMIPGLENAEIVRYGVMHRNSYINSPKLMKPTYQTIKRDDLFFAGQITGVEGYVESAASGLLAGINAAKLVNEEELIIVPTTTSIGSQANYICNASPSSFQPMNANYGIYKDLGFKHKKKERKELYAKRAIEDILVIKENI